MTHISLNTGDASDQPRSSVSDAAIDALLPMVAAGGGIIPQCAPYAVHITREDGCAVFSVHRGDEVLVLCGVAWEQEPAAGLWRTLEVVYHQLLDRPGAIAAQASPEMPSTVPWLGVVLLPSLALTARSDVGWLGDFERCLAWTIIDMD
jgi:hypothetical protein